MPRPLGKTETRRFNCDLPIPDLKHIQETRHELECDSVTELVRRALLEVYADFWEKIRRGQPVTIKYERPESRIQIVEDPQIDLTSGIKRVSLDMCPSWHAQVNKIAEEQGVSRVDVVRKGLILVKTLKDALKQGGEVGYMVDGQFRPVLYELFLSI